MIQTIQQLQEVVKVSRQLPTLGTLSWWSLEVGGVTRDQLRNIYYDVGLPERYLPKERDREEAFSLACRSFQGPGVLVRPRERTKAKRGFTFVREVLRDGQDPYYEVVGVAVLGVESGKIRVTGTFPDFNDLISRYKYFLYYYTSDDIRAVVLDVIKNELNGLGIRPNGGIYFTARQHDDTVERLAQMVNRLGRSVFFMLGIIDSEKSRLNMFQIMKSELLGELAKHQERLEQMLAKKQQVDATEIARQIRAVQKMIDKAKVYEDLLQYEAEELHQEIDRYVQRLTDMLTNKEEGKHGHEGLLGIAA